MKLILTSILMLTVGNLIAQNNQNNNNNNNDETRELFKRVATLLPLDLQRKVLPYTKKDNEEFFLFGLDSITIPSNDGSVPENPSYFMLSNYSSIEMADANNLSFSQIAHVRPINRSKNGDVIWQNFGKNAIQSQYYVCLSTLFPDLIQYDGPNPNKLVVAKLTVSSVPKITLKSLLYVMRQSNNHIETIQPIKDTEIVTAIALAPNNHCAIAQNQVGNNVISFFDISCSDEIPIIKPIDSLVQIPAKVSKLTFLENSILYACCSDKNIYKIDKSDSSKIAVDRQFFKNKDGQLMSIDQFALNPHFPVYGAFISNKKLYLVNMRKQRFTCILEIPQEQADFKVGVFGHRKIGLYKLSSANHHLDIIDPVKISLNDLALLAQQ